jgi:TonB-linked SusC/RagA family outer membrane protein
VLKDASATAIYGARGANGVVLITTKRGKAGQNNVDFQSYFGIQNLSRARPIFDPVEYAEYRAEQAANNNLAPEAWRGLNIDWNFLDSVRTAGTDWQKETFRAAPIQNYQLNFSGGTEKVRYSLGGGYFNQQGIIVNSKFDRYSLRVNLDADLNKRLKVGNNLTVAYTTTHGVATENEGGGGGASRGVVSSVFQQSPLAPVFVTEANNRLFPLQQPGDYADPNSPLAIATGRKNITNTTRLLGDIFADFKILEGLSYRLKVGASITDARRNVFFPSTTDVGNNARGRASIGSTNSINWLTESILSYNKTFFDRHNLNVVGVYSLQKNSFQSVNGEAQGFVNDVLEEYNMGAGLIRTTGSSAGDFSFKSYTGRLNYNYNQKYLFTFTTRVDGSSRFGKGNKYAVFPSAAVAWRLSDEQFMQGLNYFNDFKIRASYGITGNSEIGGYKSLNRFGPTNYTFNRLEVSGIAPFQVANDELRWEKTRQFDIGVDVSVFSNRLTLVADYYHKVTDDLLLDIDLPLYSGYGRGTVNIGSLENKGVELAILTQNLVGEFTWSTNFNISRNRNKVTKLNNADQINVGFTGGDVIKSNNSNIALIKVGYPLGAYYGAVYEGVWRDLAQIEEVGTNLNARPGQERFRDTNGDGIVNNEDFAMIGNGQPDVALGFTNNFAYKGFGLSIFMTGMLGYDIYNFARTRGESTQGGENKFRSLLNRWTIDNPDARYPYAGYAVFDGSSSKYIEKGDYLRIKNITLSYNLPGGLASWLRSARVFVSGDNLFTFTEYTGYDPEVNSRGGSATANTVMGLDMNAYPAVKIYRLGVDIGF